MKELSSFRFAPRMAGILSKKEYLAASLRLIPQNNETAMVVPDLDMPGIIAIPCPSPMMTLRMKPMEKAGIRQFLTLSEIKTTKPVMLSIRAMMSGFGLSKSLSSQS